MNILASMALRRARGRLNSVQSRAAATSTTPAPATAAPPCKDVVISGPINRYMFLQGREWAIDMVASLRAATADLVIERLTGATAGRPGSYAAGIESVIVELKNADATDQRDDENLTRQVGRKE